MIEHFTMQRTRFSSSVSKAKANMSGSFSGFDKENKMKEIL